MFRSLVALLGLIPLVFGLACAPSARPEGAYWLHTQPFPGGGPKQKLVIAGSMVSVPGHCAPVAGTFTHAGNLVVVQAQWASCSGIAGGVGYQGNFDVRDLGTARGVFFGAGLPAGEVIGTKSFRNSLRIATYNIQMIPSFQNATTSEENAHRLADRIRASSYDVVAFNEAFDAEIQDILVDDLDGTYPYYVEELDGPSSALSDSGLMLFSRLPFVDLSMTQYLVYQVGDPIPGPGSSQGYCEGSDCHKVAYYEYDECENPDCHSAKGVGLVRVRNPETGEVYNVAFTHMQASYPPPDYPNSLAAIGDAQDEYDDRTYDLDIVKQVLEGTLTNVQLNDEAVFVIGDLNVDGDLSDPILDWSEINRENLREWDDHFGTGGDFFKIRLQDGWAYSNAPKHPSGEYDRGITNVSAWGVGADGARLDYVLLNTPDTRYCIQHMTLTHNLRWSPENGPWIETGFGAKGVGLGGTQDLSDHYGVAADVNLRSSSCDPAHAQVVDPQPGVLKTLAGDVGQPGEIQWYRFETAGTYSFDLNSANGASYRVYQGKDLTTPVAQYKQEVTTFDAKSGAGAPVHFEGEEFRLTNAPFYVRVYNPDRTKTGAFSLIALKHDCSTPELACALAPGQQLAHHMLPTPPVGHPDEAWFELYTEAIPNGAAQALVFAAGEIAPAAANRFTLEVHEDDGAGNLTSIGLDASLSADPASAVGKQRLDLAAEQAGRVKYYLQVRRTIPTPPPYPLEVQDFQVRWETNLTILFGAANGGQSVHVRCLEENDGPIDDGDDEVTIESVVVDAQLVLGQTDFGDFDAGDPRTLEGVLPMPLYFTGSVEWSSFEDDDFAAGDVDWMEGTIGPLGALETGFQQRSISIDPENDGRYELYFNLTHGFDQ